MEGWKDELGRLELMADGSSLISRQTQWLIREIREHGVGDRGPKRG